MAVALFFSFNFQNFYLDHSLYGGRCHIYFLLTIETHTHAHMFILKLLRLQYFYTFNNPLSIFLFLKKLNSFVRTFRFLFIENLHKQRLASELNKKHNPFFISYYCRAKTSEIGLKSEKINEIAAAPMNVECDEKCGDDLIFFIHHLQMKKNFRVTW